MVIAEIPANVVALWSYEKTIPCHFQENNKVYAVFYYVGF